MIESEKCALATIVLGTFGGAPKAVAGSIRDDMSVLNIMMLVVERYRICR